MDVIPPLRETPFAIDAPMLTSTTVAEPSVGETAWTSGATFGLSDRSIVAAPSSAVTISIASPGVVTWTANGVPNGTPVILTTTGALPTGLTADEIYYAVNRAANTFQLAAEVDGTPIVTAGAQSGTHTAAAHIHRSYESAIAGNTDNPPAIDDGSKWIDVGPTNRWAMFDLLRNTATVGASPMTVTVTPGERVDAAGLVGLVADDVTIEVIRSGVTVYSYSQALLWRPTVSWRGYFFGKFRQRGDVSRVDLPAYVDAQIRFTLTRASGEVRCGGAVIGQGIYLGDLQYNAESDALNFSTIDRDAFGNSELVRRRSVPKIAGVLRAPKSHVDSLLEAREALNAVPALWLGLSDPAHGYYGAFSVLGVYKRWLITFDQPDYVSEQLEVEEV